MWGLEPQTLTLCEMLGHASASMTLNVYAHVVGSMKEEAAAEMDRLLA